MTNFKIQEFFNDFADSDILASAPGLPAVVEGFFSIPEGPGLGVTLDLDYVADHPTTGAHFDLFSNDWHFRGSRSEQ
jgi:galactonate dehydratase